MSIANKVTQANRQFRAHFMEQLEQGRAQFEPTLNALLMEFPSDGAGIEHNWSDGIPGLEEWTADRVMGKLGAQRVYVANKPYAAGIEVDRDDLEDDHLGLYYPRIRSLADQYWRHRFEALRDLLNAGATTECWDEKYFFDDDHPLADSSSTNDNLSTAALSEVGVQAAITMARALKDSYGKLLNVNPTHLLYGDDLEWTAKDILMQERQATGETNIMRGTLQGLRIPGMTAASWAVADLSKPLKPFMFQNRRAPEFVEVTDPESEDVFNRKRFKYGVDYRGRTYLGFYQTIVWSAGS